MPAVDPETTPHYADFDLATLAPDELGRLARSISKAELHCHLEGALTPETILDVASRHEISLPTHDLEELRPLVVYNSTDKDLLDFLAKFPVIGNVFVSQEAIDEITYSVVRNAAADNVHYLELRFSPVYMSLTHNVPLENVMEGVLSGVRRAEAHGDITVRLIGIAERQMGVVHAQEVLDLITPFKERGVVAFDLANDEYNYPPDPYADVFQEAKRRGFFITVHAGEARGFESVKVACGELGADRIGHGTRAYESRELVESLKVDRIPLEVCLTSNIQTGTAPSLAEHPFPTYLREGILVTINTDDPGVSGINLSHEFAVAASNYHLSLLDLDTLTRTAIDVAFLEDGEKLRLHRLRERSLREVSERLGRDAGLV